MSLLVTAQRVLGSETVRITALLPVLEPNEAVKAKVYIHPSSHTFTMITIM